MFYQSWLWFAQAFTVLTAFFLLAKKIGIPISESNGTTLLCNDWRRQRAVAQALEAVSERAPLTLNTSDVSRFLFSDGTSVDFLAPDASFTPPYPATALKQIVLPLLSRKAPKDVANKIATVLRGTGYTVTVISRPDSEIPGGDTVLIFSDAFQEKRCGTGFGIIVRKNALRIGGPKPKRSTAPQL